MPFADAKVFPVKNAAYRVAIEFRDNEGMLVKGWTGAASSITTDGTTVTGAAPVENGATGQGYLDLTSSQMNGYMIQIQCTVTNPDVPECTRTILTGGLLEVETAVNDSGLDDVWTQVYAAPTTLREAIAAAAMALLNENTRNGATQTIKDNLGVDALSATVQESETTTMRGQFGAA